MRRSELWKCKIGIRVGVKYFDLTNRASRLKTLSSYRVVPLHDKLLEMNIDTKLSKLQEQYSQANISIYFNKTIKPMVTDNPNKIMYSLRHTVATQLKRAEVHMDKVSEILGHSYNESSMTKEVYAKGYTLEQLREAVNYLEF